MTPYQEARCKLEANKIITELEVGTYPNYWIVSHDLNCRQYTSVTT